LQIVEIRFATCINGSAKVCRTRVRRNDDAMKCKCLVQKNKKT
jgi:hypothetical protein